MMTFSNSPTSDSNSLAADRGVNRVEFANILRGFAALCVVISHYLSVFWLKQNTVVNWTHLPALDLEKTPIPSFIYWINAVSWFHWGAYGVALFFLISGFVIPFSLQKSTWAGFLTNRFFRIFPTYMVGFSVTVLTIYLGLKTFTLPWPYTLSEVLIHYVPGLRDIVGSKNIDGIVWTLEIELKFYVLCAIGILWFQDRSKKVFLLPLIFSLVAWSLNAFLDYSTLNTPHNCPLIQNMVFSAQFMVYMFLGVAFHYLYIRKIRKRDFLMIASVLWGMFGLTWAIGPARSHFFLIWSYGLSFLTFTAAFCYPFFFKNNRIVNFMASISYPLYVVHGVAGYVVMHILLDKGIPVYLTLFLVTLSAIVISWIIHILIEYPTQKIGKNLAKLF